MRSVFDHWHHIREALKSRPLGLLFDIDGTVSEIASTPFAATVTPANRRCLAQLAQHLDVVAAVSGRPVEVAQLMVGVPGIVYIGNHGLERWENGRKHVTQGGRRYERLVAQALEELQGKLQLAGLVFEYKGLAASVHYRQSPEPAKAKRAILQAIAEASFQGILEVRLGKRVVELRPPLAADKGTAVQALIKERGLRSAFYLGDDTTDVDAFLALRTLGRTGDFRGISIVVLASETPAELVEVADYSVDGVQGVERFLQRLLEEAQSTGSG